MLRNLKAEMVRQDVKATDIAEHLQVRLSTVYDKLNGHYGFSFNEALSIKRHFFPTCNIEYLFENHANQAV